MTRLPAGVRELPPITTADGRTLQLCEAGDPAGRIALYLHGTGSSRLEVAHYADGGQRHGVRFVAWNRPGSGGSTEQPDRTALSVVDDARAVAAAVGADRPVVMGHSGGGCHVLVLAAAAPDLVRAGVALNPGPPADDAIMAELPGGVRGPIKLARDRPKVFDRIGRLMEGGGGPIGRLLQKTLTDKNDQAMVADPDIAARITAAAGEGAQQPRAYTKECRILWGRPWGVELTSFAVPLHVFAGRTDPFLPFALRLGRAGAHLHYLEGGHLAPYAAAALDEITALVAREGSSDG